MERLEHHRAALMATLDPVNVNVHSVMKNLTLTVNMTGLRRQAIRNWLGCQLIRLAASVMGCNVAIVRESR
jgi:hypothetical protein